MHSVKSISGSSTDHISAFLQKRRLTFPTTTNPCFPHYQVKFSKSHIRSTTYCVMQPPLTAPPMLGNMDLKVTMNRASTIVPVTKTERRFMFLSNIDQALNFNISVILFFSMNPDFPQQRVLERLEMALKEVLVPYDFLAGRLRMNPDKKGRLEIDCNSAGIDFIVSSSELTLADLGDLVSANPAFEQLVVTSWEHLLLHDRPLFTIQVTSFKCGGFSLGYSLNHALFDGFAAKIFLENVASLTAGESLLLTPHNNRDVLAARTPPRVTFPHPELLNLQIPPSQQPNFLASLLPAQDLQRKTFSLTSQHILNLKQKSKLSTRFITSFHVAAAHIWRCKARAVARSTEESVSKILYAVNIRSRVRPRLPLAYSGNAVVNGYCEATCGELERAPFGRVVEMVAGAGRRITDEYVRSVIDWGEMNRGVPSGDVHVSSWWKLGLDELEFAWGGPVCSVPVLLNHCSNIIVLIPDAKGRRKMSGSEGVKVVVALPLEEMETFQALFYQFMEEA